MYYDREIRSAFRMQDGNRVLFSFWTHFPDDDLNAQKLANMSLEFWREYQVDFLKTMPNGMYAIEDYGCEIDFSQISKGGVASVEKTPFQVVEDWTKLTSIPPSHGALKRELDSLSIILEKIENTPVIFTVFSPMTIANKLSRGRIYDQIKLGHNLEIIHSALSVIANDVARLCEAAISLGATGVFFAHQDTDRTLLDLDTFTDYVVPYDYEALCGARNRKFNILHLHGSSARFLEMSNYPVEGINWHAWETIPSVSAASMMTDKCLVGGINRWSITNGDRAELEKQIDQTLKDSTGRNIILTPGCTIRHPVDKSTLEYLRDYIRTSDLEALPL